MYPPETRVAGIATALSAVVTSKVRIVKRGRISGATFQSGNGTVQRAAANDLQADDKASHRRSGAVRPTMGVILWGESPLYFVPVSSMGVMIPNG